jgi:beta-lactamase regulating signal transducer with metallopeptidase domain
MSFGNALGWTLVHFLWEGALIAALFALSQALLRRSSANLRYLAGCGAMLCMLAAPLVTLVALGKRTPPNSDDLAAALQQGSGFAACFPVLIGIWLAGVVLLSVWSAGGWVVAQRLRIKSRRPIPTEWQGRMVNLCRRVGIARTVRVFQTALTEVPMVVGWLRPVILVPVCALTNLNVLQLEALLAHELAHIRRHDYLVNLVQTAIETLLFYHPAVWWLGNRIRDERENCCDDIAVAVCGSTLVYASALANLEQNRATSAKLAMAASNGSLLNRIRRLTSQPQYSGTGAPGWLLTLAVTFGVAMVLVSSTARLRGDERRFDSPESRRFAPTHRTSFVAGLARAGYTDISVDDIIALKEHGVSPQYMLSITGAGIGRPSPQELIQLHERGVDAAHVQQARDLGLASLSVDRLIQLKDSGILSGKRHKR